jgi:hypothetical protein
MAAPPGWVKKGSAGRLPRPTGYPAGTVWLCSCSRAWLRRPGHHYGNNPHIGHTEGSWAPVQWWHRTIRRAIAEHQRQADYERACQIISEFNPQAVH